MASVIQRASLVTLISLSVHYLCFYVFQWPLLTDTIAQWIMARTPNQYALWLLGNLGSWAKPFAMTGGLAAAGFGIIVIGLRWWTVLLVAPVFAWLFEYHSIGGHLSLWLAAVVLLHRPARRSSEASVGSLAVDRRTALAMIAGTFAVAVESFARDRHVASRAVASFDVAPFTPPLDQFGDGLVRKNVTPVAEFYGMSKNTVDPTPDPQTWSLRITLDGRVLRQVSYSDLLSLSRTSFYSTMRCVSNTLKSDLMGTAQWTGVRLRQLIDPAALPAGLAEVAILGVDGHGDSLPLDFAFSDGTLLALGMNGKSLNRTHGFPLRLVTPRYYGFKNVKWIGEIALVSKPYFGTWPKMGYTKDPLVHTGCFIDRVVRDGGQIRLGGVAFAGDRGIREVQVRADNGAWRNVVLEEPISPLTWRRWIVALPVAEAATVQARAMDGTGRSQADEESPLFPDGVRGPTIRKVS
jgi:DMSO/TMAO reductase YedYZ molybdopterin-dependent catalytic subunit